jgi:RNA polymerase sigma-70 factor, ECF subfamily
VGDSPKDRTAAFNQEPAGSSGVKWPAMEAGDADAQLMLRYAQGDARAFDQLYANHRSALWRFIRRTVGSAAATDDVFQECWSRVIEHRARYQPAARFATWLYRIAHNCCMDHWRKTGRRARHETADEDAIALAPENPTAGPLEASLARESHERLAAALEAMPEEQRAAFLLYVEAGLSLAEIGEITGVNPETAKSRLRYAVARLKRTLGAEAPTD